ncbi:MAG TPA: FAD-dependent oxidoreductase [Candidatus Aphodoplasma excrementigallinarum]|uniref:FAD-dependent oxidoreductase n=1 Tax=Candidatus Aphodoplasma excrementigallinarum TaxID=2840673 RepID=A0A9D1NGS0_9FIRM|nr:FAD-dependent oxidoreductase [Candidatus Aphodoplasma excrementigallinarum]
MKSLTYSNSIPYTGDFDVAVCGGGVAGFCAAIAAARMGAKTCVIEKNRMLGGVMTSGGNNDIGLFCAGDRPVIRGIGWEFARRLNKMGYADIPVFQDGISHSLQGVKVNIPMAACLMDTMCLEENVALSFGTTIVDVRRDGGLWLLICAKKGALSAVRTKFVIDCTGDGDAAVCAGAEYELGDPLTGTLQPGTLRFIPSTFDAGVLTKEQMQKSFAQQLEKGSLRKSDFWPGAKGDPREIVTHHGDNINHVEISADYEQKTETIEIEARRSLARITNWMRQIPGFEAFSMEYLCDGVAYRETRRILGDVYVTVDDYVQARVWDDSVCYAYFPVDLHQHESVADERVHNIFLDKNHVPTIPLRALIVRGLDNFLIAGRCVSSDRLANSGLRVKAPCMAMGQAAGSAAALALRHGVGIRGLDIQELKSALSDAGCIVP